MLFQEQYRREMDHVSLEDGQMADLVDAMIARRSHTHKNAFRRTVAIVAAAVLVCACMGAGIVRWHQAEVHYTNTMGEATAGTSADAEKSGASAAAAGVAPQIVEDYSFPNYKSMEERLADSDLVLQHEKGDAEDSWNEMLEAENGYFISSTWTADTLEGLQFLWPEGAPKLSFSWLESHAAPVPGSTMFYQQQDKENGKIRYSMLFGAYQMENGARFDLDFTWHPIGESNNVWISAPNWTQEIYTTRDGAEVSIARAISVSGNPVYEADIQVGLVSFHISGTFPEQEDLHQVLDSLELARLLEP